MKKSPVLAATLNLLPGLGYLYVGTRVTFALFLIGSALLTVLAAFMAPLADDYAYQYTIWDFLPCVAVLIGFAIDAFMDAKHFNKSTKISEK